MTSTSVCEHPEPQQAIQVLIEMLQCFHANDSEKTCEWCLADLTTHDDGDLASHLSACGPIRNLATWLCGPLLHPSHGGGKAGSTPGSVGTDGGRLHQKRSAAQTATRPTCHTIMAAFKKQQLGSHSKDSSTDGQLADSSRPRLSCDSESDMLHHVPPLGTRRHHPDDTTAIDGMEKEKDSRRRPSIEATPICQHPHHTGGKSPEDPSLQTGGQTSGSQSEVTVDPRGQELAIPTMVSSEKGVGDQPQETLHTDGRNAAERHPTSGVLQRGGCGSEISLLQSPDPTGPSDPSEAGPNGQPAGAVERVAIWSHCG